MEKGEMGENATGRLATYYVAECMEFNRYGEYREDIQSAEEAVKYYQSMQGFPWMRFGNTCRKIPVNRSCW